MNPMIETQLKHRTIRFYEDKVVPQEVLETLLAVANRTATSNNLQGFSIIRVTDIDKRQKLAKICNQAYVENVPEFWLFVIDSYRNSQIAKAKGYEGTNYRSMDFFVQGAADAYLAAQNVTNAVESMKMGAIFFGSILNDAQALIELFDLPELTFPILGLGFGYPNDNPTIKPRMDIKLKLGENSYPHHHHILDVLDEYDEEMQTYYDTRDRNRRVDAFTDQVKQRYEIAPPLRAKLLRVVKNQGFDLNLVG